MAVEQPDSGVVQMPYGAQLTEMTLSPAALCHYITDEELEGLSEMHQDPVKDICLAAIGGFIGAIVPAYDGLSRFGNAVHPMTKTDLVSMFVASATLAVIVVTGALWKRKSDAKGSAVQNIRSRPKMPVRLAHDNAA